MVTATVNRVKPFASFINKLARWSPLWVFLLVFGTYNPSGTSFYHYAADVFQANAQTPWTYILVAIVVILWFLLLKATYDSLGILGLIICVALGAAVVWAFVYEGWITLGTDASTQWLGLALSTVILALGLRWLKIWRRITGQLSTRDVDREEEDEAD